VKAPAPLAGVALEEQLLFESLLQPPEGAGAGASAAAAPRRYHRILRSTSVARLLDVIASAHAVVNSNSSEAVAARRWALGVMQTDSLSDSGAATPLTARCSAPLPMDVSLSDLLAAGELCNGSTLVLARHGQLQHEHSEAGDGASRWPA